MHILIGLVLGVVLLYFWLIGHWFARVLVFLLACAISIGLAAAITSEFAGPPADRVVLALVLALVFGTIGWFIASAPVYYWRHKLRPVYEAAYRWELRKQQLLSQKPKLSPPTVPLVQPRPAPEPVFQPLPDGMLARHRRFFANKPWHHG